MNRRILAGIFVLMLVTVACGSAMPIQQVDSISTIVASTIQALTASVPVATQPLATNMTATPSAPAPNGKTVAFGNVGFTIPDGLASSATDETTIEVELPYINPSLGDMPSHHKYVIQSYEYGQSNLTPRILVFNANEFAGYSDLTKAMIADLQNSKGQSQPTPDSTLLVSSFHGEIKSMSFQNGYGWGYLTQINNGLSPINNADLFYYFQGLTNDGKYYVSAILPVNIPFLAATSDLAAPVPAGGIPFPNPNPPDENLYNNYLQSVTNKLNAASQDIFQPSLVQLDALIQSIKISQ